MKYVLILCLILGVGCLSCREDTMQHVIRNNIGKKIVMKGLDVINYLDKTLSYTEFRKKYKYISIIYIDQDCSVCKTTVLEWNKHIKQLKEISGNIAYLFVYRGDKPSMYFKELSDAYQSAYKDNDFCFFIAQDPDFKFITYNNDIPHSVIDASIVIDEHNRITLIGQPFINQRMMELYQKIIKK